MQKENTDPQRAGLVEQEAPEKNTDDAFVKVKEDGSPETGGNGNENAGTTPAEAPKK